MAIEYVLGSILILLGIALIVLVLLQKGKGKNKMGAVAGGSSDTFFGKNQSTTKEKMLEKITTIIAIVFVVLSIVTYLVQIGINRSSAANTNTNSEPAVVQPTDTTADTTDTAGTTDTTDTAGTTDTTETE